MALKPLGNTFLFSFLNDIGQGQFIEKNRGSILVVAPDLSKQATLARWGRVEAVGPKVTDFTVGEIVLIEALQWTIKYKIDERWFWKSDESKVMAIGLDESVAFTY